MHTRRLVYYKIMTKLMWTNCALLNPRNIWHFVTAYKYGGHIFFSATVHLQFGGLEVLKLEDVFVARKGIHPVGY